MTKMNPYASEMLKSRIGDLGNELYDELTRERSLGGIKDYFKGCLDQENARLYGSFQQRAALNITQFPKIQGSLLVRMGLVYPLISALVEQIGIPRDCSDQVFGVDVNYHTWLAGYLAYLSEIQLGLSKYPIEAVTNAAKKTGEYFTKKRKGS